MKKSKALKKNTGWGIFGITFLFLAVVGFIAYRQLQRYEKGILGVYAVQQDGYVQLVLDQINLLEDRNNEEIVTKILASLDASTYRYWTLAEDRSIVFVKDVLETNRYKSFTSQTYYAAIDIEEFIEKLRVDNVIHDIIYSNGEIYVTSGVKFNYGGNMYTLCLMTESQFILNQNEYMGAKIILSMLGALLLVGFLVGVMALVLLTERWYKQYVDEERENKELTKIIENLNEQVTKDMLFNTKHGAFFGNALPTLFAKLQNKSALPLAMFILKAPKGEERDRFFEKALILLDKKTIKVIIDDVYILMLMAKTDVFSVEKKEELENLLVIKMEGYKFIGNPEASLSDVYDKLLEEVKSRG